MSAEPGPDRGPYLGAFLDGRRLHGHIRYRGPKHLISIGPPGSNKSVGLAVPNIADLPRSMIIMDCKGQLAAITARRRAKLGRVIVVNPFGLFVDRLPHLKSHRFNPMATLDRKDEKFASNASGIAESLVPIDANEHQKIFPEGARSLYALAIMWESMQKGAAANLAGVRNMLMKPTVRDPTTKQPVGGFLKTLLDMAACNFRPVANRAGRILERFDDQGSGNTSLHDKIDTGLTKTDSLDEPPIARDLAGPGIDFGRFREEITTCYIILPTAELVTHSIWLRLLIGSALRALYQTPLPDPGKALPPVYFLLDEFAALGRLEAIETALGVARDYSLQMHVMLQDLNQLKDLYPQRWETFLTGAGAVTTFAPRDWFTAEFLARFCGQRTEIIASQNLGINPHGGASSGQSWAPQGLPLVRPEELQRMPRGRMLCMVEPEPMPFYTEAPPYPDTRFDVDLDPNPYFRRRAA